MPNAIGTAQYASVLEQVYGCTDKILRAHSENEAIRLIGGTAASNLGIFLKEQGDLAGAKAACERGIELGDGGAAYNLGILLAREGDVEGAKAMITAGCTDLQPEDDWSFYLRALVYLIDKKTNEARTYLTNAINYAHAQYDNDRQNWRNTFNLALYYLAAGEVEKAERLFDEGINGKASVDRLTEALGDLQDFLIFFPDHQQAPLLKRKLEHAIKA